MQDLPHQTKLSAAARAHLLAEVSQLAGAALQKLWLVSPTLVVLQLRVPGRSALVLVDQALALASLVQGARPAAADGAPKSQATLRAALEGSRFDGLRLEVPQDAPMEATSPALRLSFTSSNGPRALLADPRAGALAATATTPRALSAAQSERGEQAEAIEKVIWAGPGIATAQRPGQPWPAARALPALAAPEQDGGAEADARAELSRQAAAAVEGQRQALLRRLRARQKKLERTLAAVEADAARAGASAGERHQAELLLPHQSRVPRGTREIALPDWSQLTGDGGPTEVRLALDPALSAAENAARWLKRSSRYGAAAGRIAQRHAEVARAVAAAAALVRQAERAAGAEELRALSLAADATSPQNATAPRERPGRPAPRLPFRTFRASNRARILVGRSARDNDALTFQRARGDDLWLHVRGVQGSHVVVPEPGEAPDSNTLVEAALLAAWFSSARGEEQADIAWTRRKYVRKPRGAGPGAVVYTQDKTLRLRHDQALLDGLLAREEK